MNKQNKKKIKKWRTRDKKHIVGKSEIFQKLDDVIFCSSFFLNLRARKTL